MSYDATAKKLAVKVIGTIESNLNYTAVNYGDPITVGIAQWYGTRAAALLDRMRDTSPGSWYGVAGSLASQLLTIAATDPWWNGRRLTREEGDSLAGVMGRNQGLQNTQLTEDLEAYKGAAVDHGMDPDANTAAMIFFFAMYHQGPVYAFQVLDAAGPTAGLEALFTACMANPVLGKYGARYKTARDLIAAADLTGVDPGPDPAPTFPNGNARYIQRVGDTLAAHFGDGETVLFYPNGSGMYLPGAATATPTPVQPAPPADNGEWVLPLTGGAVVTSGYGPRAFDGLASFHWGLDLALPGGGAGDAVAPCPLVITVAFEAGTPGDPSSGTAGSYVKGHTLDGAYTFNFYHLVPGSIAVAAGDTVARGAKLGTEGESGNAAGVHLHFEAYAGNYASPWPPPYGSPVDPLPLLRAHGVVI